MVVPLSRVRQRHVVYWLFGLAVAWLTPMSAPMSTPMALSVVTIALVSAQCHVVPITPMKVANAGIAMSPTHLRIAYAFGLSRYVVVLSSMVCSLVFGDGADDDERHADDCCDGDCCVHCVSSYAVVMCATAFLCAASRSF